MHIYYNFGLLLIIFLSVSAHHTRAAPTSANHNSSYDDNYSDDYDDYYDETNRSDDKISLDARPMTTSTVASITPTTNNAKPLFSTSPINYPRSNHVLEPSCPKVCLCLEDYKHILCNSAGLTQVPKDLPHTTLILDLSENHIAELRTEDFSNITKVREINLSGNRLKTVNNEAFAELKYLQRLRITDNKLAHVEPNAFSGTDLRELDLSNNSIVLRSDGPFLIQPALLKFNCRNCSWTQLYDDTFKELVSLNSLKLDLNDFNMQINVKAFMPLRNIIKLRLPELEPEKVAELCNLLKTIDNISFKHFEISCFELVLGTSYNGSITLVTDPPYIPPEIAIVPTNVPEAEPTKATPKRGGTINKEIGVQNKQAQVGATKSPTLSAVVKQQDSKKEASEARMPHLSSFSNLTAPTATTRIEDPLITPKPSILTASVLSGTDGAAFNRAENATVKSAVETDSSHQVHISQDMVNLLLICIIIIAIVGIIIGVICRKDVGGIKTKCCRTRKPEPKDQVRPAEEIPLNKLT
ncbi:vasorin isoform X1 [Anastrepha obliqua]|uniref:vasorin isoform X1 n=1 Tax=Anastrepha obliqua TaxID=95512 RepID=UPI002408FD31|nr:vasorin isoform X1 [Anastrepha obliqua]